MCILPQNETQQVALSAPDTLSLTIQDLESGLTPEALSWLFDNLNVRTFLKDLAKIAPAEPEGVGGEHVSTG